MKKKSIIIIITVLILILMLIPIPTQMKNGDKEYKAILYKYTKIHRPSDSSATGYEDGWEFKVLGIKVSGELNRHIENEQNSNIKKYKKSIDDITLSLEFPNDWNYEELTSDKENDSYKYALKMYKSSADKYAILYLYNQAFAVCGTGRTDEQIDLNNGNKATIGYYDGNSIWQDISFYDINKNIAIINQGLDKKDSKEVITIIKTINIIQNNEKKDISLNVKNETITSKSATFIMKNSSDYEYDYGADWYIEYKDNNSWKELETITGEPLAWNSIAYVIKPNEEKEFSIDWSYGYGELKKGNYRLMKKVVKTENNSVDDSKVLNLYAEFEIR